MITFFSSPLEKGIQLLRQQKYAEGIKYFTQLIEKKTFVYESFFNLAKCHLKLGNFREAKDNFKRSIEGPPSAPIIAGILEVTNWRILASPRFFNNSPVFAPDGEKLVYVSARRDTNSDGKINAFDRAGIYLMHIDTGREQCIVPDDFYNSQPAFSPDGRRLVYLSARAGAAEKGALPSEKNPGLYLLDLQTGYEVNLLNETYRVKYPAFTPDGKKVIFSCWLPNSKISGVYTLDIATKRMETLVPNFYEITFPSLSPKGDKVVYSSWRRDSNGDGIIDFHDNSGIYMKHMADNREIVLASDNYNNSFPVFSPDGEKVVYLSVRRDTNKDGKVDYLDNSGVYLLDLNRRKEQCLVDDTFYNKFPNFTPDGRQVIFISNWRRSQGTEDDEANYLFENKGVYAVDVNNQEIRQIVSDKYYGNRSPVVSPKGEHIAYISWRKDTNRGLYLAYINRFPTKEELRIWIETNF